MTTPSLPDALSSIRARFVSGNSVPVSSARITRDELEALEALLRERNALRGFAEGFKFTVTDSYYKDSYLSITRPDKSVVYRLSNNSTVSDDIADVERRRVEALAGPKP